MLKGKFLAMVCLSLAAMPAWAMDSYRFFHVTIDTPKFLFLFLLLFILAPFVLMAALAWRFAGKKPDQKQS